ncbi:hypothetical protein Kpol_1063p21 [Vanderwaltozyma polyspora DSM 70294]|uniref:BAG domain-containing protein n=1 Tax=Vanderwaltozyma polyspora (strain ATCC 22028 / DSM 70294 / BCRC 21397 / CBS 2163 / NBRC 10782 / NRRL Y-8283 / UCD 57-17) TaxID=436907 RepID=A7TQR5_VANPO|nr:uncharacterized protein Kpol_1063p21 [Vanderwaltozyma polyspora DSM 70294]EDO15410.1 hypothetical protein Kpol_1063p21 [Vanderwaltozyma polyspora DSM 70294]
MNSITDCINNAFRPYVGHDIVDESNFLFTLCLTGAAATLIAAIVWGYSSQPKSSKKSSKKKKAKKTSPVQAAPQTYEERIQNVINKYNKEYKDGILKLCESFDKSNESEVYQRNFLNEMLLKLMIELDGIDLVDVEGERRAQLKQSRKSAIKLIQGQLSKLDSLL